MSSVVLRGSDNLIFEVVQWIFGRSKLDFRTGCDGDN